MNHRDFSQPVHVNGADGKLVAITSLYDAFDFLHAWPRERRGVIYETAMRACCAAHDGHFPVPAARKAFEGFARSAKILADAPIVEPWMFGANSARGGVPA